MDPMLPQLEQVKPKLSFNPWVVLCLMLLLVMGTLSMIFAPAYKRVTKELKQAGVTITNLTAEKQTLQATVNNLRETMSKSYVSGSTKVPVYGPNGQVAYAETKFKAFNMSNVRESISQAVQQAAQSVQSSHYAAVTIHEKGETIVKRGNVDLGLGYSTDDLVCPFASLRAWGPAGVWGVGGVNFRDTKKPFKRFDVGGKITF